MQARIWEIDINGTFLLLGLLFRRPLLSSVNRIFQTPSVRMKGIRESLFQWRLAAVQVSVI